MKSIIALAFLVLLAGAAQANPINISCTDSIKSLGMTGSMQIEAVCPVNCTRGSVWGTGTYTTDSALCVAAVHDGTVDSSGGAIKVNLKPGQSSYNGSSNNGVNTQSWGAYGQSFVFVKNAPTDVINISCTDSVKSLGKTGTSDFAVVCPVNCTRGSVWGSDLYTTDSALCVAAVHSGVIKTDGGRVGVHLKPGQSSYTGTSRNGVTTGKWGAYGQSFQLSQ